MQQTPDIIHPPAGPGEEESAALIPTSSSINHIPANPVSLGDLLKYVATPTSLQKNYWLDVARILLALGVVPMYPNPSWLAGCRDFGPVGGSFEIGGNVGMAILAAFNVGGYYANRVRVGQDVRLTLRELNFTNPRERCCKHILKGIGSVQPDVLFPAIILAIPYLTTSLQYPLYEGEPIALRWFLSLVIWAVNSLTHTLPLILMKENKLVSFLIWKLLFAPITWPIKGLQRWHYQCLSPSIREARQIQLTESDKQKELQRQLAQLFYNLAAAIEKRGFADIETTQTQIASASPEECLSNLEKLKKQYLNILQASEVHGYCYKVFSKLWEIAWAVITIYSINGFMKGTYDSFYKWFNNIFLPILPSTPPLILTAILTGYFGGISGRSSFETITALLQGKFKLPFAFRLNLKLSIPLFLLFSFFNAFSSGTARQLVYDGFPEETYGMYAKFSSVFVRLGLLAYGFPNLGGVVSAFVKFYTSHFGNEVYQRWLASVKYWQRMGDLTSAMQPATVKAFLTGTPPNSLKNLGFQQQLQTPPVQAPSVNIGTSTCSCCLFHRGQTHASAEPIPITNTKQQSALTRKSCCRQVVDNFLSFFCCRRSRSDERQPLLFPSEASSANASVTNVPAPNLVMSSSV